MSSSQTFPSRSPILVSKPLAPEFTVAIPTYNGEHRLPELLERLRAQVNTEDFRWEILIVDNNSTDQTAEVIRTFQADWPNQYPIRYLFEGRQGSAYARQRAVQAAESELIGFLDDDNIPALDWVAAAYAFAQSHPRAGAYASQIHGDFEAAPPQNFRRIAGFLAITERGPQPLLYDPGKKLLPPSAGLVVRKSVWSRYVPQTFTLRGRVGQSQGQAIAASEPGEDLELLLHIQNAGWEIWYNPDMEMHHKIPHWRFERDYLLAMFRGIGLSRYHTRMLSVKPWQRPLAALAYILNDMRKILRHWLKYRTVIPQDLVATCEMELFRNSFLSPFHHWKKTLKN
ncbi:glycosyltransferase family 2 protein [Trichocoleus sp. FACHB-46]|nr:glycosyltransferase family 2 protein [Trichocoleus sp. FACHB-46]